MKRTTFSNNGGLILGRVRGRKRNVDVRRQPNGKAVPSQVCCTPQLLEHRRRVFGDMAAEPDVQAPIDEPLAILALRGRITMAQAEAGWWLAGISRRVYGTAVPTPTALARMQPPPPPDDEDAKRWRRQADGLLDTGLWERRCLDLAYAELDRVKARALVVRIAVHRNMLLVDRLSRSTVSTGAEAMLAMLRIGLDVLTNMDRPRLTGDELLRAEQEVAA